MLNLSHKGLEVYKLSLGLVKGVYEITKGFPKEEQFVLCSQMKRAAISVLSNIAEGASRISRLEKKRFYEISRSSLVELDSQLEVSLLLNYLNKVQLQELEKQLVSVFRILSKMIENLNKTPLATS